MAGGAISYSYRYAFPSAVASKNDGKELRLSTSEIGDTYPYFFEGRVHHPRLFAQQLGALAKLVSTRFYVPPGMLLAMIAQRDPVVTSGGDLLRFEGFSACCSAYARIDVTPNAYQGKVVQNGTTNVDFNTPMRTALAQVRDDDRLGVSVGAEEFRLRRGFESVVERKVELPMRWLKGFVEVQAYQSRMEHRFTLSRTETIKFLRSLPRTVNTKSSFVVLPAGQGLRLSQTRGKDGIELSGLNRLLMLADFVAQADELKVFATADGQSSEWRLRCKDLVLVLTLSADASRGFSGEGQVLENLIEQDDDCLARVRAQLKWQSVVHVDDIAAVVGMPVGSVRNAVAALGSRGLVGYDCDSRSYFHREMPFDYSAVASLHPRLVQARKLVEANGVSLRSQSEAVIEAEVRGSDVLHNVSVAEDSWRCTCQWYAKYQGGRGPCKHVLAVQLVTMGGDE